MIGVILTADRRVLVRRRQEDDRDSLPYSEPGTDDTDSIYVYSCQGCRCVVKETTLAEAPGGYRLVPLRDCWDVLPHDQYRMACKGAELLNLDRTTRYCGRCGGMLRRASNGLSKVCCNCGAEVFPQVSPCIIVLVRRGDKALLVHAASFRRPFFGLVAGYVETGETLEECVRREVMEETSLEITNLHYEGSQPWPNPANIMLGFTADYAAGELRFADGELTSGGFFGVDELPTLPSGASIARRLIDRWIESRRTAR